MSFVCSSGSTPILMHERSFLVYGDLNGGRRDAAKRASRPLSSWRLREYRSFLIRLVVRAGLHIRVEPLAFPRSQTRRHNNNMETHQSASRNWLLLKVQRQLMGINNSTSSLWPLFCFFASQHLNRRARLLCWRGNTF